MAVNRIINANIVTPYRIIPNGEVCYENGKITYVGITRNRIASDAVIDAQGNYLSSGFIDLHTHGAGGHDFMDGTTEAFIKACEMHAQHGTTCLFPTTLACSNDELLTVIDSYRQVRKMSHHGAIPYGLHLEGPYFALSQKGAQDERYIKAPDKVEYEHILSLCHDGEIARWTAAVELEGIDQFAKTLREHNVLASIGHSDAVLSEVEQAFENGFSHITHLYSGMSAMVRRGGYRYPGVTESAYMLDEMTVEIIADGKHLPPSILRQVYLQKGADKIALVTDSMRGAGMPDGVSTLGSMNNGQQVVIEDGVAKLMDKTAFAGSVATADRLVRNMIKLAGATLCDAVRMMTSTPAKIAKIKNKGKVVVGYDADLILFDAEIQIKATIVGGNVVYQAK